MHKIILTGALAFTSMAYAEQPPCDVHSKAVGSFEQAIERIDRLPEFIEWKSGHSFPIAYGLGPDKQEFIRGHCYWDIPVYANRPERFENWQMFYVAADRKSIFVFDAVFAGPITLGEWRKQRAQWRKEASSSK